MRAHSPYDVSSSVRPSEHQDHKIAQSDRHSDFVNKNEMCGKYLFRNSKRMTNSLVFKFSAWILPCAIQTAPIEDFGKLSSKAMKCHQETK